MWFGRVFRARSFKVTGRTPSPTPPAMPLTVHLIRVSGAVKWAPEEFVFQDVSTATIEDLQNSLAAAKWNWPEKLTQDPVPANYVVRWVNGLQLQDVSMDTQLLVNGHYAVAVTVKLKRSKVDKTDAHEAAHKGAESAEAVGTKRGRGGAREKDRGEWMLPGASIGSEHEFAECLKKIHSNEAMASEARRKGNLSRVEEIEAKTHELRQKKRAAAELHPEWVTTSGRKVLKEQEEDGERVLASMNKSFTKIARDVAQLNQRSSERLSLAVEGKDVETAASTPALTNAPSTPLTSLPFSSLPAEEQQKLMDFMRAWSATQTEKKP